MKLKPVSGCLGTAIMVTGGLAVLIGWAEFMFKPIRFYAKQKNSSLSEALADLVQINHPAFDWPVASIVWLVASVLLLYLATVLIMRPVRRALDFIERAEAPISILESEIELKMLDSDLNLCRTTRKQLLHANSDGVDAYHYNQTSSHGIFDASSLSISSRLGGINVTANLITRIIGKKLETIEQFSQSLPTNPFATYMPDNWVRFLFRHLNWFRRSVIVRECKITDMGEYSVPTPTYQLTALRYPASNINITISILRKSVCKKETFKAFLVMAQAVRALPVVEHDIDDDRFAMIVELQSLKQAQSVLITWENEPSSQSTKSAIPAP